MILRTRSNVYIHQLSVIAWFVLLCLPVFGKLPVNSDTWVFLCTQKGVEFYDAAQAGDQSNTHSSESCACSTETYASQQYIDRAIVLPPQYYVVNPEPFYLVKLEYLPRQSRAPPLANIASTTV